MMSNWMHDMFKQDDDVRPVMLVVSPFHLYDNPVLANQIAQFIFRVLDQEELEVLEEEIIDHLINSLKAADEDRFRRKLVPLAQEDEYLTSKELH